MPDSSGILIHWGISRLFKNDDRNENVEFKEPILNGTYAIEKTYTKPYAACRYCHPAIEAAIHIKEKYEIERKDVCSIQVKTYYWAVNKHDHTVIPSIASAKMSIPFGVAVGFIYGKAGLKEYDLLHIKNEDILNLTEKVSVLSDDELTDLFPEMTTAIVTLITNSGETYGEGGFPKGEPENPLKEKMNSMRDSLNWQYMEVRLQWKRESLLNV